jgi:hypothetical protein
MSEIRDKLNKLRKRVDDGEYGRLYGAKETADDYLKITYATLRDMAPDGSVADKDAWVKRQPGYLEAVERKQNAYADWKTVETYMKLSFSEFDIWRSEETTNRGLDRRST